MISQNLQIPVSHHCDVLVCGGGIAGISAALSAARGGKEVILLEKQYMLGGLATAGLITYYLPLCDGMGKQVSFGIAEELLRLSIALGAESRYPKNWLDNEGTRTEKDPRFEVQYNPFKFALLAERLLLDHKVKILYGSYAVDAVVNHQKIEYAVIENKSGRLAISAKSFIDATGDADLAHFAGAPTDRFQQKNVLPGWYYSLSKTGYQLNVVGYADKPENKKSDADRERTKNLERFGGLDGDELSMMMQKSHQMTLEHFLEKQKKDPDAIPTSLSIIPQIRMTRKLCGEYSLDDTEMHTYFEDSIGMVSDWRERGPIYEVPFGTLYSAKMKNLLMAGRCTSVSESMWDIMRVIPCCAVTGEAAGTAASITDDFSEMDLPLLQETLRKNGVVLHEKDLK